MANEPDDFGSGLNVKHGLRYLYTRFSFGGENNPAFETGMDRVFGTKPKEFCSQCDKRFSWCECHNDKRCVFLTMDESQRRMCRPSDWVLCENCQKGGVK
jgi:hypothetical protein